MSNIDHKAVCENCVHFSQKEGQCRKYVPRGAVCKGCPSVDKTDSCREFKKNPPEERPKSSVHRE
jgi:hypothetical protein